MRITNSMMVSGFLKNFSRSMEKLDRLHNQVVTGRVMLRPSDDVARTNRIMMLNASLGRLARYESNVGVAGDLLTQTESSLNELNSLFKRAYELTVNARSDTNGPDERSAIANEIEQIAQQIVAAGNSSFNGRYIFGGGNTTVPPFEIRDESGSKVLYYNGVNLNEIMQPGNEAVYDSFSKARISFEIGFGSEMEVTYNGIDIFGAGENNAFNVLMGLAKALRTGDSDTIDKALSQVKARENSVISLMGDLGGRTNRLEFFRERLETDKENTKKMLSDAEDIEIEEAIMNYNMQLAAFQAALFTGSKVVVSSIMDFLR